MTLSAKKCALALISAVLMQVSVVHAVHPTSSDYDCIPHNTVLLPASNESISHSALIPKIKDKKVVLLGEHHDNIEHHRWQLQMIIALHTLNPQLVLGFEMFPRDVQPALDAWVAGELTEEEFLKQARWDEYWTFDKSLYIGIFHFARMNRIPMIALNVDRSLIRQVGKEGWDNIPVEKREGVGKAAPASQGYRELLAGVFMRHGSKHGEGDKEKSEDALQKVLANPSFNRFVESQSVWDRAMAEGIVAGSRNHNDAQVVAIMGSGHMMYRFGVPEQLNALGASSTSVLIPWDPEFECSYISDDFSDAIVGLRTSRFSQKQGDTDRPRLGVFLEPADNGVKIAKVVEKSVAETIGLLDGDVIIEMAGKKVVEVNDVIDRVKNTQFGTWLPLKVLRNGKDSIEAIAKFPAQ